MKVAIFLLQKAHPCVNTESMSFEPFCVKVRWEVWLAPRSKIETLLNSRPKFSRQPRKHRK